MTEASGTRKFSLNYKEQCAQIEANGNLPEEWLEYIEFMKKSIDLMDESRKVKVLTKMYNTAIKSISESCKSLSRAQLYIEYADFKRLQSPNETETILTVARRTLRHHAIVHVACADFELSRGDQDKAVKILRHAQMYGAAPASKIKLAIDKLNSGEGSLYDRTAFYKHFSKEGTSPDSGLESSRECTRSEYSMHNDLSRDLASQAALPQRAYSTQELQEGLDLMANYDMSTPRHRPKHNIQVPEPPVLLSSRDFPNKFSRSTSSCAVSSVDQPPNKPSLRPSLNSVPNLKCASVIKDSAKKRMLPRRVPVRVPKKLNEPEDSCDLDFALLNLPPRPSTVDLADLNDLPVEHSSGSKAIPAPSSENQRGADIQDIPQVDKNSLDGFSLNKQRLKASSRCENMDNVDKENLVGQHMPVDQQQCPRDRQMKVLSPQKENLNKDVEQALEKQKHRVLPSGDSSSATYVARPSSDPVIPQTTPAKAPAQPLQQKVKYVNGHCYTVMGLVGRGGSAKVFRVFDNSSFSIRALKVVDLAGLNPSILEGYMNEIRLLQKLSACSKVIDLFDWEHDECRQKLLMVLECGETDLATYISQNAKNPSNLYDLMTAASWGQMVVAVHAMHQEGVIHSDLKPANFILVSGQVKLIDFGIAKALQVDNTSVLKESMVGTPSYMSPEALIAYHNTGGDKPKYKVGMRSDVWSLGCILYQMVFGKTPFQHLRNKLQAIVDPSHEICFPDKQKPVLIDMLKKCLTRDVSQRPTTAELLEHPYLRSYD